MWQTCDKGQNKNNTHTQDPSAQRLLPPWTMFISPGGVATINIRKQVEPCNVLSRTEFYNSPNVGISKKTCGAQHMASFTTVSITNSVFQVSLPLPETRTQAHLLNRPIHTNFQQFPTHSKDRNSWVLNHPPGFPLPHQGQHCPGSTFH